MISATPATRVFLFEAAVDIRKDFEGLSAPASDKLVAVLTLGLILVSSNAARNRFKTSGHGSGVWVCGKRLDRDRFYPPSSDDARSPGGKFRISASELSMLPDGLDFGRAQKRRWWRKSVG